MATFNVKPLRAANLGKRLRKFADSRVDKLAPVVNRGARKIHGRMVKLVQTGSRSGQVYQRGSITHRASAPGEPPKSDTGNLVRNMLFDIERSRSVVTGFVRVRTPYALALEFGRKDGSIAPRPYISVAIDIEIGRIEREIKEALRGG